MPFALAPRSGERVRAPGAPSRPINLIERRSLPQGRATAVVSRAIGSGTPENSESRPDLVIATWRWRLARSGRWMPRTVDRPGGRAGWIGGRGRARRTGGRRGAGDRDPFDAAVATDVRDPVRGRGRCAGGDAAAAGYHPVRRLFLRRQPHVLRPLRRWARPGAPRLSPAARGLRGPRRRLHLRTPSQPGCTACRVVTGADVTGIERDCPGPIADLGFACRATPAGAADAALQADHPQQRLEAERDRLRDQAGRDAPPPRAPSASPAA